MGDSASAGQTFSTTVGLLYVFNLIVGTGALALPRAFQTAGYLLSTILLLISAFASYVCVTFVLESLAIANCVLRRTCPDFADDIDADELASSVDGEMSEVRVGSVVVNDGAAQHRFSLSAVPTTATSSPLPILTLDRQRMLQPEDFEITKRVEISEMAQLFLGQAGTLFAYLVLTLYLFGDLAIYSTTVPKSLMNVICSSLNASSPVNASQPCHDQSGDLFHHIDRFTVYRLCIIALCLFCMPMILMGMTKTKWLQMATTVSRWTAFLLMIVLASVQLVQNGPKGRPAAADFHGFGSLSGVAVYAFMCHHSIPGLVTPIRSKHNLSARLTSVYVLIYLFYCALSLTGSFAFEHVHDIYTINFLHDEQKGGFLGALADYFLALFPVFVLSSSYVIVAITLSNNIRVLGSLLFNSAKTAAAEGTDRQRLITSTSTMANGSAGAESEALLVSEFHSPSSARPSPLPSSRFTALFHRFGVPLLVVALPASISFFTDNVLLLASITGSFPGVGVQFVLPTVLVLAARHSLPSSSSSSHPHPLLPSSSSSSLVPPSLRSPFSHWAWPFAILGWAFFAIIIVSVNFFHSH